MRPRVPRFTSIAQAMRRTHAVRSRRTPGFYFAKAARIKTIPATAAGRFLSNLAASHGAHPGREHAFRGSTGIAHHAQCAGRAVRSRPKGRFASRLFVLCEFRSIRHFIQPVDDAVGSRSGGGLSGRLFCVPRLKRANRARLGAHRARSFRGTLVVFFRCVFAEHRFRDRGHQV